VEKNIALDVPEQFANQLGWDAGDICEGAVVNGELRLVRTQTKHDHAMEIAEKMMDEYSELFESLAKS
jgi:hypothetical protein